jgi:AraC-like DNA-binding protein
MGRIDRHDLEHLSHHLTLKIAEAAEVCFQFTGRNRHSFNRMFLVIGEDGGKNFIHNHTSGQHLPMRTGIIYFIPSNTDLEFSFATDMRFISFHFYLELFNNFDVFSMQNQFATSPDSNNFIPELSAIIRGEFTLSSQCRLQGIVMELAAVFLKAETTQAEKIYFITRKYAALFEFIKNEANAMTTIDDLAAIVRIPRDTLSREFSRDCGVTLKQYLIQAIVRHAEKLLLEPQASARAVAEALRFNNEYYFSRFFKKNTGRTPGEYRQQENRLLFPDDSPISSALRKNQKQI